MPDLTQFHFIRPWFFLLLIPLIWLLWQYHSQRGFKNEWQKTVDPVLLSFLLKGQADHIKKRFPFLIALVGIISIIAVAGPTWKQISQPVYRQTQPLVIAFDLSRSMESNDLKPNRLTQAKRKLLDLLALRKEGQTALLVYAAQPFVVVPLTEDNQTIVSLVNTLQTDMMPAQGSNSLLAYQKAVELLKQAQRKTGHILFITDGINASDELIQMIKKQADQYPLSILAVGTTQGAPIPDSQGQYVKDQQGNIVLPKLNPTLLQKLALYGGGRYTALTLGDQDIKGLLAEIDSQQNSDFLIQQQKAQLFADQWHEEGVWLTFILIPLVLFAFRRGILVIAFIISIPFATPPADALNWQDLWLNSDQQAYQKLQQKQFKPAMEQFKDPLWKATTAYKAGDYQATLDYLAGLETPDALYNKGNAQARLGQYKKAIENYKKVLEKNPQYTDAKENKALLEKLLKEQQKKDQKNKDQKNKDQQSKDQQSKDQQSKDQQSKDQQSKDQQSKDQQSKDQQSKDQQSKDQQSKDQQSKDQQSKDQQSKDQQSKDQQSKDQQSKDQQDKDQKKKDKAQQIAEQKQKEAEKAAKEKAKLAKKKPLTEEEKRLNQATEQWLKRIPDDPARLLRNKFKYQYQRQYQGQSEQQQW